MRHSQRTLGSSTLLLPAHRSRVEALEDRTFLSAVVDDERESVVASPRAVQTASSEEHEHESSDDDSAEDSVHPQSTSSPEIEIEDAKDSESEDSDAQSAPTVDPQTPAPSPSETGSTPAEADLLTQTAPVQGTGAWASMASIADTSSVLETGNYITGELASAVSAVKVTADSALVTTTSLIAETGRQFAGAVFASAGAINMARVGLEEIRQVPIVAEALAMIGPAIPSVDQGNAVFSRKRIYHFAKLGNPMTLLSDAIASFAEESSRIPVLKQSSSARMRAWSVTAAVLMIDAAALAWYRSRKRRCIVA
jgi:hypothetical protein